MIMNTVGVWDSIFQLGHSLVFVPDLTPLFQDDKGRDGKSTDLPPWRRGKPGEAKPLVTLVSQLQNRTFPK